MYFLAFTRTRLNVVQSVLRGASPESGPRPGGSVVSVSDSGSGGCGFDTRLRRTFFFRVFSPLTSAEACEKSSRWLWKESCVSTGVKKPENT